MAEEQPVPAATSDDPLPPDKPRVTVREKLMGKMGAEGGEISSESPRTKDGINYTAAFVMYAAGIASLAEISRAWKIPYRRLAQRSYHENWSGLVRRYGQHFQKTPEQKQADPAEMAAKAKKIQDNRDKITTTSHALMDQIKKILDDAKESGLDTETIVDLSRSVKMLGEITMVASGDEFAVRHLMEGGQGAKGKGDNNRGPLIQINMPNVISAPRKVREIGTVVERVARELERDALEHEDEAEKPDDIPGNDEFIATPEEKPPVEVQATVSEE